MSPTLTITLISFGFKHNAPPPEAEFVFDVRFLNNPYWDAGLSDFNGTHPDIAEYIRQDPAFSEFIESFSRMMKPLFPRFIEKERTELTIAVGCTGGVHRSVFTALECGALFEEWGYETHILHRDINA